MSRLDLVKQLKRKNPNLNNSEIEKIIKPKYNFDSLGLETIWVNVTEKYMYNPPHNHQGIYSWVLFHDIPYSLEEERKDYRAFRY